jgi:hypothetical protein
MDNIVKILRSLIGMTRVTIDEFALETYLDTLRKMPEEKAVEILMGFYRQSKWPSIEDINARVGKKAADPTMQAKLVAEEIVKMIGAVGCPHPAAADDAMKRLSPVARHVVQNRGGWGIICQLTTDELSWRMRDWEQSAYAQITSGRALDNDLLSANKNPALRLVIDAPKKVD